MYLEGVPKFNTLGKLNCLHCLLR